MEPGRVSGGMEEDRTPRDLREGVRRGILSSIRQDVELRGGHTARLLVAAGAVGVLGAIGVTLLLSGHPYDHHPTWHVTVFTTVWAGLLVVSLAVAFLRVRTPSLHLSRAAAVGLFGLGLAGICGAACPDQHFLHWWSDTELGAAVMRLAGPALGAACFGLITTLFFATTSALLLLADRDRTSTRPLLPAAVLLVLLLPGIALQSVGTTEGVFMGWLGGAALGAYLGIDVGSRARRAFTRS